MVRFEGQGESTGVRTQPVLDATPVVLWRSDLSTRLLLSSGLVQYKDLVGIEECLWEATGVTVGINGAGQASLRHLRAKHFDALAGRSNLRAFCGYRWR